MVDVVLKETSLLHPHYTDLGTRKGDFIRPARDAMAPELRRAYYDFTKALENRNTSLASFVFLMGGLSSARSQVYQM